MIRLVSGAFAVVEWVDSHACRVPLVGRVRGAVLDTLFGRAEDIDYVSTTTPNGPPPAV